ncbi:MULTISPECIES: LacI family DNA-binding transcriptional regulator [Rhodococcus]|uniref:LacI family DNA-binding transcriptional regulator n=1 Tax=Rhodococcus TaxID=1827 RepID=UPI0002ED2136|nr:MULTISPECIES: LacI family DNA-binding transcriptional regulator [Rhodococcus]AOD21690.1 LacI family transcriptional regulator [Rhodococcus sp. p52]AWZ23662.1 LacI family transcriptional regulator [Rhodococcus pyridinivorans]KHJ74299.1 LacI family transcriptional regulator [Rhodococcus sp. Chr-9]MCD2143196.1 LacI family DNA-binding transcriptional regulator [Rhodococcus pyridinivorans]MCW3470672.1 LacI family DNA-binding transcriptional regulator [Rhodococcus pyridinivorans]
MSRSRQPRRQATLASIAAELKISRTTVSNAYNRPDQLSAELRERVLEVAKRRGYAGPDPMARSLRTRKAGAVGVLLTEALSYSFRDPAAMSFLSGLSEACEAAGQGLLLIPAGPGRTDDEAAQVVHRSSVDGFVVYSVPAEDPYLAAVLERHLPIVACDQPRGLESTPVVGIDDRRAMRDLAAHLIELGHRQIGMLSMRLGRERHDGVVDLSTLESGAFHVQRERIRGVQDAMSAAGLAPESLTVVERYTHTAEDGLSAAAQIMRMNPRITALVCTTDVLALGALAWANQMGLDVPGHLSITGFDGIDEAIREGLTTVRQPQKDKGRRAGELLLAAPSHSGVPALETLGTQLWFGATSGRVESEWYAE